MVQPAVLSTSVDIITPDVYGITLKSTPVDILLSDTPLPLALRDNSLSTSVDICSYSNSNRCLLKLV